MIRRATFPAGHGLRGHGAGSTLIVEPDGTDQITIRVKRSVLVYFKAPGRGYQTRMNRVLESYVQTRMGDPASIRD